MNPPWLIFKNCYIPYGQFLVCAHVFVSFYLFILYYFFWCPANRTCFLDGGRCFLSCVLSIWSTQQGTQSQLHNMCVCVFWFLFVDRFIFWVKCVYLVLFQAQVLFESSYCPDLFLRSDVSAVSSSRWLSSSAGGRSSAAVWHAVPW